MTSFFKKKVIGETDENQKTWKELIDEYAKQLLPNITKTGIEQVDDNYKPKEDKKPDNNPMAMMGDLMNQQQKKKPGFQIFMEDNFPVSFDLDQLLSMAYENEENTEKQKEIERRLEWTIRKNTKGEDPVCGILTILMSSFMTINDPILEKKCLSLMMRVYSQRHDMIKNLRLLQIIFDEERNQLYDVLKAHQKDLTKCIE